MKYCKRCGEQVPHKTACRRRLDTFAMSAFDMLNAMATWHAQDARFPGEVPGHPWPWRQDGPHAEDDHCALRTLCERLAHSHVDSSRFETDRPDGLVERFMYYAVPEMIIRGRLARDLPEWAAVSDNRRWAMVRQFRRQHRWFPSMRSLYEEMER